MVAFADILEYFLPLFLKVISQFWYLKFETLILSELTWAKSTSAWVIQFSQLCLFRKCLFSRAATPSLPLPFLLFFLHFFYDAGMKSGALCMLGKRSKLTNEDSVSHWIAQTGLELTVLPSVTLNSRSSCLAPNSGMIRRMPYVLPAWVLDASVDLNLWPRFWALCTVSSLASWVCLDTGPAVCWFLRVCSLPWSGQREVPASFFMSNVVLAPWGLLFLTEPQEILYLFGVFFSCPERNVSFNIYLHFDTGSGLIE